MAEGQRMTAADVVAQVRDGRLEDFVREAVVLVARELMEAEISRDRPSSGRSRPMCGSTHRNGYRRAAVGDAGRGDRAADPADAPGQLFSVVSGAATAL